MSGMNYRKMEVGNYYESGDGYCRSLRAKEIASIDLSLTKMRGKTTFWTNAI